MKIKNDNNNGKYIIISNENNKTYAICALCYKNNDVTLLVEDWKPYDHGHKQSKHYYCCPKHSEISIVTDSELPLKKD